MVSCHRFWFIELYFLNISLQCLLRKSSSSAPHEWFGCKASQSGAKIMHFTCLNLYIWNSMTSTRSHRPAFFFCHCRVIIIICNDWNGAEYFHFFLHTSHGLACVRRRTSHFSCFRIIFFWFFHDIYLLVNTLRFFDLLRKKQLDFSARVRNRKQRKPVVPLLGVQKYDYGITHVRCSMTSTSITNSSRSNNQNIRLQCIFRRNSRFMIWTNRIWYHLIEPFQYQQPITSRFRFCAYCLSLVFPFHRT